MRFKDVTGWADLVARCLAAQAQRRSELREADVSVSRVVVKDRLREVPGPNNSGPKPRAKLGGDAPKGLGRKRKNAPNKPLVFLAPTRDGVNRPASAAPKLRKGAPECKTFAGCTTETEVPVGRPHVDARRMSSGFNCPTEAGVAVHFVGP